MRLALVTTPPELRSGIGDYTRHLLPYLEQGAEVRCFVSDEHIGHTERGTDGRSYAPASRLDAQDFDQVLYQLGNERNHAFMLPLLERLGGVVMLHDWVLFDLAVASWPELARGGWRAPWRAWREGGLGAARRIVSQRLGLLAPPDEDEGCDLLAGWHAFEGNGRWTEGRALVRAPEQGASTLRWRFSAPAGRSLVLRSLAGVARCVAHGGEQQLEIELPRDAPALVQLDVTPVRRTRAQRAHGDRRRLGAFVHALECTGQNGTRAIDLSRRAGRSTAELSDARFELALNRRVLAAADGFLVHSQELAQRLRAVRGPALPLRVVPHGAERRWADVDRGRLRRQLAGDALGADEFLIVSLGALQRHKRLDRLIEGFARALRQDARLRLALVGPLVPEELDAHALVRRAGLEQVVHITGWQPEARSLDWLRAADLCVNLRGPSTGGSSGGIFQALSAGRGVIASELAEQAELPASCVLKVAAGPAECDTLAATLLRVRRDAELRRGMEAAARAFVERECHWSHVARGYLELLRGTPLRSSARRVEHAA